jgi:hypothetical protein
MIYDQCRDVIQTAGCAFTRSCAFTQEERIPEEENDPKPSRHSSDDEDDDSGPPSDDQGEDNDSEAPSDDEDEDDDSGFLSDDEDEGMTMGRTKKKMTPDFSGTMIRRKDLLPTITTPELIPGVIFKNKRKNGLVHERPQRSSHVEAGGGNVREPWLKKTRRGF